MHQLFHFQVSFGRLRKTVYLFKFCLFLLRNVELGFKKCFDPFPDVLLILTPINISPNLDHQLQIFYFTRLLVLIPSFFPDPLEQILTIPFPVLKSSFIILQHLVKNEQSVVIVFGMNQRFDSFIAFLCKLLVFHELKKKLGGEMNYLLTLLGSGMSEEGIEVQIQFC